MVIWFTKWCTNQRLNVPSRFLTKMVGTATILIILLIQFFVNQILFHVCVWGKSYLCANGACRMLKLCSNIFIQILTLAALRGNTQSTTWTIKDVTVFLILFFLSFFCINEFGLKFE